MGSNKRTVVLFEITVELRYLNKLRKFSRHEVPPTKRQAPHKPLICPTGQVRVGSGSDFDARIREVRHPVNGHCQLEHSGAKCARSGNSYRDISSIYPKALCKALFISSAQAGL